MEDDEAVLRLCRSVLERDGHLVWCAADGRQALQALARRPLRLALIDLVLPGAHGVEVARDLRAAGMNGPVVYMSGYPLSELPTDETPEVLSAYFLAKPFTPDQLAAIVRTALEESR